MGKWEQDQADRAREAQQRAEIEERVDAKVAKRQQEQQERSSRELEYVINLIKADPTAWMLIRAFMAVMDERNALHQQIEGAEESLGWQSELCERRSSELRSQNTHALQELSEAQDTIRDMQYDLDEAQGKLRKAGIR